MNESIKVETDLFENRDVQPHFINPCCFGGDFAGWLRGELSRDVNSSFAVSEILQEDYGWGWIAVSYVGDGPQDAPAQWIISVAPDPGLNIIKRMFQNQDPEMLNELRHRVWQILAANPAIKIIGF